MQYEIELNLVGGTAFLRLGGRDVFLHIEPREDPEAYVQIKRAKDAREAAQQLEGARDALVAFAESKERAQPMSPIAQAAWDTACAMNAAQKLGGENVVML